MTEGDFMDGFYFAVDLWKITCEQYPYATRAELIGRHREATIKTHNALTRARTEAKLIRIGVNYASNSRSKRRTASDTNSERAVKPSESRFR